MTTTPSEPLPDAGDPAGGAPQSSTARDQTMRASTDLATHTPDAARADAHTPGAEAAANVALGAGRERRLHPLSWLFVLLAQLRSFALPLIALIFFNRGDSWEFLGLVAAAALALLAVVQYYTYRFRIEASELVIRSGLISRNVRHLPLARIQNVALRRNVLHRMFSVAEVKLESAVGGVSAEAQMRVLSLRDAAALETLVRASRGDAVAALDTADAPAVEGETLLQLPLPELVKLGLTSNRGLVLGAAGIGVFAQFDSDGFGDIVADVGKSVFGYAAGLHLGVLQWLVVLPLLALVIVAVLRVVSVLLTILQFFDFRLSELDDRLRVEAGLLTRIRSNAALRKIQHWTVRESLLLRWFGRRSLKVETAVMQTGNETQGLSELAPIAPPAVVDALLARWLPWLQLDTLDWQPLHPRAWRRMVFWPLLLTVLVCAPLCWRFGAWGLLPLLSIPWWIVRARKLASTCAWAVTDRVLVWRSGWLDRRLSFAEIGKLQGLVLAQSPFERRRGMATLCADTAGANPFGHRLDLHYLPEEAARALYARLAPQIARSALRW